QASALKITRARHCAPRVGGSLYDKSDLWSAAMTKLVAAGFASGLSFVLLTVSPALGDRPAPPSGAPTLKLASQLGPSRGGASGLPRGYLPLHARGYALAKAAANAKAGVGNGRPKPRPGGGGGPTIFNPPNVAPSFDGT